MKQLLFLAPALAALAAGAAAPSHWDGGRVPPLHRLAVKDVEGDTIVPGEPNAQPMSTRETCSLCHDVEAIASGWHFNASDPNVCPGRPAQPWFAIDPATGTQIPLSYRPWKGVFNPADIGMDAFAFTAAFGRNLPGGGASEPQGEAKDEGRWSVSGALGVNCFACHDQSGSYDFSEYVKQMARQNFAWAMTAAMGWGDVDGISERMPDYWGALNGPNRDDAIFRVPATVAYDDRQFDAKHRLSMKVGKPKSEQCLNCHGTTEAGAPNTAIDGDVHLRAGMSCADCHRNGVDHKISRGFERPDLSPEEKTLTCAGCHAGEGCPAGRYGAPAPQHVGFPLIHFEKLSCTVCHSGVTKGGRLGEVTTSRANRMGVYGVAKWLTDAPFIQEPIFMKNEMTGKIEPHRAVWPAYWGVRGAGDEIKPLASEKVAALAGKLLTPMQDVGAVLKMLDSNPNWAASGYRPVLAVEGKLFRANVDGLPVPFGEKAGLNGFWYVKDPARKPAEPDEKAPEAISAIPEKYDAAFDAGEDAAAIEAQEEKTKRVANLITTLEASPLYTAGVCGAVVANGKIHFVLPGTGGEVKVEPAPAACTADAFGFYNPATKQFDSLVCPCACKVVSELAGTRATLTEGMIAAVLKKLVAAKLGEVVYVGNGLVWSLDGETLVAKEEPASAPVTWSVGHDVKPARMARGARPVKCADCHTPSSEFFFGEITPTGPVLTERAVVKTQGESMGVDGTYHVAFGAMFLVRPLFKIFLWAVFGVLALVVMAFAAMGLPALIRKVQPQTVPERFVALIDLLAGWGLALTALYLALSGAYGFLTGAMTSWILVGHQLAGGCFAACLLVLLWLRGIKRIRTERAGWWMLAYLFAALAVFTAVAPMMTIFGSGWQLTLLWAHRCTTFCFLAVASWMLLTGGRKE